MKLKMALIKQWCLDLLVCVKTENSPKFYELAHVLANDFQVSLVNVHMLEYLCCVMKWVDKKNMSRVMRNRIFVYAKTKTQISFAVTPKLISAFVFAIRIV